MGECFITRRGGGGTSKAFAVISVTYPAGSVCTCTDGTKTLTLKDTGGQGFFLIPYAAAWTVTATDGVETTSESVEITTYGQSFSLHLSYDLVLYSNGTYIKSFTARSGSCGSIPSAKPTIRNESDYFNMAVAANTAGSYVTDDVIDVTDYGALKLKYKHIASSTNDSWDCVICLSEKPTDNWYSTYVMRKAIPLASSLSELTVDVSAISGKYYVLLGVFSRDLDVYDLRFKR